MRKWWSRIAIAVLSVLCVGQFVSAQTQKQQEARSSALIGVDTPAVPEQVERGRRIAEELGVGPAAARQSEMDGSGFVEYGQQYIFPGVYGRGGLTFKEREMVVIATIITQGVPSGLNWHFRDIARKAGMTERELQEVIFTTCFYAGWPKCSAAMSEFRRVMNGPNEWPKAQRGLAPIPRS